MIELPAPNPVTLARRADIAAAMRAIVPDGVIGDEATLTAFDCDALTAYRQRPLLCVLPASADQVAAVLAYAARENIRIVPRGTGQRRSSGGGAGLCRAREYPHRAARRGDIIVWRRAAPRGRHIAGAFPHE